MKIIHIITGLSNGGAEAVLFRLATCDGNNCHQVISLMDAGYYGERLIASGVQVHTLNMSRGRVTVSGITKLYKLLKVIKPDVVQTWMYHADLIGGIFARLAGIRTVIWGIRGPFNRQLTSLQTTVTIRLCALLSKWIPSVVVSNSKHAAQVHENVGYDSSKLVYIPNGYSFDDFRPTRKESNAFRQEMDLGPETILLGMVARFDPYKDHDNLLAALSIISKGAYKICCALVGDEMEVDNVSLRRLIEKHDVGDIVKLLGPRDDVSEVMAGLDLHLLSSLAESFPNVLAEAMACGTPCITTDVGDAALIVGDTGWVVPPSDPDEMADAIGEALIEMKKSSKWSAKRTACRERVLKNYTLEGMIMSYNKSWEDNINAK